MEVYNEAWGPNWGFVPITEDEVAFQAKNLKPVLDEDWAMIAELDGKVVGAALTLPDFNQALKKMNGQHLPVRLVALPAPQEVHRPPPRLRARRQVRATSTSASPRRSTCATCETAAPLPQKGGEMGWILETNKPMNRAMEGMGGTIAKRYRLVREARCRGSDSPAAVRCCRLTRV